MNLEDIAHRYWDEYATVSHENATIDVLQLVDALVGVADDDIVVMIEAIADEAPSDGSASIEDDVVLVPALAFLGAGPIEDLLVRHGRQFFDEIDAAARRNERFRIALRCAWFDGKVDDDMAKRLRHFGGTL